MIAFTPAEVPRLGAGLFPPRFQRQRWVGMLAVLIGLTGCANTPPGHQTVLTKAAGIPEITIHCQKDMWDKTERPYIRAKVSKPAHGMVTVTMTGTSLVDYLEGLNMDGYDRVDPDPVAARMYKAIAPVVSAVRSEERGGKYAPSITVRDLDVKSSRQGG